MSEVGWVRLEDEQDWKYAQKILKSLNPINLNSDSVEEQEDKMSELGWVGLEDGLDWNICLNNPKIP